MFNLIAIRWDSFDPKTLHPPSSSHHHQPNHSYPPPSPEQRGDGAERKHTGGMYQHTNMAPAQALHCYSALHVWSPVLVTPPDPNHRNSDISLGHPSLHQLCPLPWNLREHLFCANTVLQDLAGGLQQNLTSRATTQRGEPFCCSLHADAREKQFCCPEYEKLYSSHLVHVQKS